MKPLVWIVALALSTACVVEIAEESSSMLRP